MCRPRFSQPRHLTTEMELRFPDGVCLWLQDRWTQVGRERGWGGTKGMLRRGLWHGTGWQTEVR